MNMKPKQTMLEFFMRADVRKQQDIQQQTHFGSPMHKAAFEEIKRLAREVGAEKFIGDYK